MTVGRLTSETRACNEAAIRAAMDRLLRGELPPGGRCDLKTLAAAAGVTRTGFYPKKDPDGTIRPGPYQHLAEEFQHRLDALTAAGATPDPRQAQLERLTADNASLRGRLADRDAQIAELTNFKTRAISRLAAQHDEIETLRTQLQAVAVAPDPVIPISLRPADGAPGVDS